MNAPTFRTIPIADITPDPRQPRRTFDPVELRRLAASLKAQGVIEPIVVRPIGPLEVEAHAKPGRRFPKYVLVAGERRWRAAQLKEAGPLEALDAIVREYDAGAARTAQLVENDQRVGLTPLERAEAYVRWIQTPAKPPRLAKDLAELIGEDDAHVSQTIALLALPKGARDLLSRGAISFAHGRELGRLRDFPQGQNKILDLLEERIRWGAVFTTRELASRVGRELAARKATAARALARKRKGKGKSAAPSRTPPRIDFEAERQERRAVELARAKVMHAQAPAWIVALRKDRLWRAAARIPREIVRELHRGLHWPSWGEHQRAGNVVRRAARTSAHRIVAFLWFRRQWPQIEKAIGTAAAKLRAAEKATARVSARKVAPARKGGRK